MPQQLDGGEIMGSQKIEEMRGAANGRGFAGAYAAEAKIVQLEGQKRRIAGAHERLADGLLYAAAKRGYRDWIPNLKQNGFRPVRQPIKFRVGVFDRDDGILRGNQRALFDSLNS